MDSQSSPDEETKSNNKTKGDSRRSAKSSKRESKQKLEESHHELKTSAKDRKTRRENQFRKKKSKERPVAEKKFSKTKRCDQSKKINDKECIDLWSAQASSQLKPRKLSRPKREEKDELKEKSGRKKNPKYSLPRKTRSEGGNELMREASVKSTNSAKDGRRKQSTSSERLDDRFKCDNNYSDFLSTLKSERGSRLEKYFPVSKLPAKPTKYSDHERKDEEYDESESAKEIEILTCLANKISKRKDLAYECYQMAQRHYENYTREEITIKSQLQSLKETMKKELNIVRD